MQGLTSLDLSTNGVRSAGARAIAERLTELTSLNLSGNGIDEEGVLAIARSGSETALDLGWNAVTAACVLAIADGLPGLRSLSLARAQLTDEASRRVGQRLRALTHLNLHLVDLAEHGLALVESLPPLTSLNLANCHISKDVAMATSHHLGTLTSLNLDFNQVDDAAMSAIALRLKNLVSLSVAGNEISASSIAAVAGGLPALKSLNIGFVGPGEDGDVLLRVAAGLPKLTAFRAGRVVATARALHSLMAGLPELTSLGLYDAGIDDEAIIMLGEGGGRLITLDLSMNQISDRGARVIASNMTSLVSLSLSQNKIGAAGVRAIAEALTGLAYLSVRKNSIGDEGMRTIARYLTALEGIDAEEVGMGRAGACAIAERCRDLEHVDFGNNKIGDVAIAAIVESMTGLSWLNVGYAGIANLPETIGNLTHLVGLVLAGNQLNELPRGLLKLESLRYIMVRANPGLNLPPELAEGDMDADRVLGWYFQRKRRLNEAKVLMVGQGGVGKTSLVGAVLHDRRADPDERKTEKIRIDTWSIPSAHEGETIRVNVWDFGGQEIMHATHQFFLTKRSVYVLVLDARQGEIEGNVHYWLQTIQSFGGDSPVIVVTNKSDVQPLSLNENGLKRQYDRTAITFERVSCTTLAGIAKLRDALTMSIRHLEHVENEVPETYFRVKQELEKAALERQYVDMAEYRRLCLAHGVTHEREQGQLLRFLHDLGTVLNFDDPESPYQVGDTNILHPEWVTEGVYAIINNQPLMQAQGTLELARLPEILKDAERYPKDKQRFIVEMMRKFELCFDFAGRPDTLLVPELLSKNEPDINWKDPKDCLNFVFTYEVLPSGLLPRFIVRMHHALTAKPTMWRSGVVLSIDGCKVLVRGDSRAKVVEVSVDGPSQTQRSALATVRNEFAAIHRTMPRLKVEERVPLPDLPAVTVPYAYLLELEAEARLDPAAGDFRPEGLPKGRARRYSARQLLNGIDGGAGGATAVSPSAPGRRSRSEPAPAARRGKPAVGELALIFLVLFGGIGLTVFAELKVAMDPAARALAAVATVVLLVVAIVFIGLFSGAMKGPMAERLLGQVMAKVSPIGGRREPKILTGGDSPGAVLPTEKSEQGGHGDGKAS
jgi:small GTP-binding protein